MKYAKLVMVTFMLSSWSVLPAQDTLVVDATTLQQSIEDFLNDSRKKGYWGAQTQLLHSVDSGYVKLLLKRGGLVLVDQFHFDGISEKESSFLKKEILKGKGRLLSADLDKTGLILSNLRYSLRAKPIVSKDSDGEFHVSYLIKDSPSLGIDALAAFNQEAGADTFAFYGHIDISAPNLSGSGNSLDFFWKRLNPGSESFDIAYRHPWIFSSPLAVSTGFSREVVDGNYQILKKDLGVEWTVDWDRSLLIHFQDHRSIITYEGGLENQDWAATHRQSIGLGYRQNAIDRANHKGFALNTTLYQELNFEASSISHLIGRSEFEFPLQKITYLNQRSAIQIQTSVDEQADPSRLLPIGGVNSVRGYAENKYRSPSIATLQHDLIIKLGSQSRLFGILDMGFYLDAGSVEQMLGYGIGVQLRSGRGPIRIVLASHPGLSIQNSFLHIQYSRKTAWIDR